MKLQQSIKLLKLYLSSKNIIRWIPNIKLQNLITMIGVIVMIRFYNFIKNKKHKIVGILLSLPYTKKEINKKLRKETVKLENSLILGPGKRSK